MLEQLFGSRTRTKLLRIFLMHPEKAFYIRELTRLIDTQINSVRRELQNLTESGVIRDVELSVLSDGEQSIPSKKSRTSSDKQPKKYFRANPDFILHSELKSLFAKSPRLLQNALEQELDHLGTIDLVVLTGFFVDREDTPIDMLIVGAVLRSRLSKLVHGFEKEIEREINYTTMTTDEFLYRKSIVDRFLFSILEGKKIVVVDRLGA